MNPGVNFNVDKEVWKRYKKFCIDKGVSASSRIENFMKEEMEKD